jgi:1-deoxy-D-xylulose-5-phosphate reductoisomerase
VGGHPVSDRLRIAILGSTGSIGRQAVDVAGRFPERLEVIALAAHSSAELIAEQATALGVQYVALSDPVAAARLSGLLEGARSATGDAIEIGAGDEAVTDLAELPEVDLVLNALVGAAGLRTTVVALSAGKTLALANKESLVAGGELVTRLARPGNLIPVDSEHSAIFQCLVGEPAAAVSRIWLTASGGPFRGRTRAQLESVTAAEALAHPTWTMGPKITIDSATLMNKGLEIIEAHHLFGTPYDNITVLVHPQSCVHSMVEYADGSVKAHLGATDMRIPIQYAFSHPDRWEGPIASVDFAKLGRLDFAEPDFETFRCLGLAISAGKTGGTMPAAMNAANEVAVAAFLEGSCRFTDIDKVVESVMEAHRAEALDSIDQVETVDAWARAATSRLLASTP